VLGYVGTVHGVQVPEEIHNVSGNVVAAGFGPSTHFRGNVMPNVVLSFGVCFFVSPFKAALVLFVFGGVSFSVGNSAGFLPSQFEGFGGRDKFLFSSNVGSVGILVVEFGDVKHG
jgi:hypothetical protein